ncbi:30S ribosomal protein S4 [Geopsychrobacter electrodiphilus]|uniref:30S ribosomal protein S4 n=1 Tax=Geopsychrobacter electrodiphilus TaxID=225196 RepID=UPI000379A31C|nr:30S ribosomal protein S4 [Geopsychrobacter electrodiphilus]
MAKFTGPKGKIVRRFGVNIFGNPKYDELLQRRNQAPGQHGPKPRRHKSSDYALQLIEKQKLRLSYGMLEKQFRRVFHKAQQITGVTGDNLLILLETRLDNLIFRAGFSHSLAQARQLVNHGHLRVNERRVDIASYQVKPGDSISVRENEKTSTLIAGCLKERRRFAVNPWFEVEPETLQIRVKRLPLRDEIQSPALENLIVEYYSK